ncbi:MAG: zinc dependent phospholipase C family protein [Chloroflexi bacterium]|nr:zinc dependent phospholipase C family protein [Chloroflexota bacterium]
MPNLTAHLDIALECAASLSHDAIGEHLGAFLLGSCTPDIRMVTHGHRDDTHFAPISNDILGAGMASMFQAHPGLATAGALSASTQAFMAGYISHLLADEAWIIKMYRPYFGNREVYPDEVTANVMDRAVQLDMDRLAVERHAGFQRVAPALTEAHQGVNVEFLNRQTLAEFRQRVAESAQRPFTWERLLFMARRQYPQENGTAQAIAQQFLDALPHSLEQVYRQVPRRAVGEYRETIVRAWGRAMEGYLP